MNKTEFFEAVKNGVLENLKKTDETLEATINKVTKINNIIYTGLSFRSMTARVAPVVYLDDFFARFSDDDLSLDDVIGSYMETSRKPPSTISPMSSSITIGMVIKGRRTSAIVGFSLFLPLSYV